MCVNTLNIKFNIIFGKIINLKNYNFADLLTINIEN